jgi:hypothetical protein
METSIEARKSAETSALVYYMIKSFALNKLIAVPDLMSLAEVVTELANRLKEEQESGEQEG